MRVYVIQSSSLVIASEAKQSMARREQRMDCFASLAMTWIGRGVLDTRIRTGMTVWFAATIAPRYPCGVTDILAQSRRPISTQSWVLRRSAMLTASQMPMAVSATVNASAATLASMR